MTDTFSKDLNEILEVEKTIKNEIKVRKGMDNKDQKTFYV